MIGGPLRAGAVKLATIAAAAVIFAAVFLIAGRLMPKPDPLPAQLARQDEKTAARTVEFIAADTARQTEAARLQIDLTTKDIRDAFDALPPPAQPAAAGAPAPALPAAPVDRLRDRLNEGIARANGAAGAADPTR